MKYRNEADSMGTVRVPQGAYYGSQTQRAKENFPISGLQFSLPFIHTLAQIKFHAAQVNLELMLLDPNIANAVIRASHEIREGKFDDQFVVDVFQTGSGTSTHMNLNEVVAGRANEILTGKRGGRSPVHPNDHVNLGQSSNDIFPSAIHVCGAVLIRTGLIPSLKELHASLTRKATEFASVQKIGRTHLQDALPISLGQEFSGYARQVELAIRRIKQSLESLFELPLGGTAVGNGVNTHPEFAGQVIAGIADETGLPFVEAKNHFEAQGAQDASVETSGALKSAAVGFIKIANDIRWLASGPRCGLGEITIPPLQPGSSMMPGKVNPVICEAVIQASMQIMGNDATIAIAGQGGHFELNTCLPVIAYNLLQSITLLTGTARAFSQKCIDGIAANRKACLSGIDKSLALATLLVPHIGYDRSAALAKKAYESGKTIREIAVDEKILPKALLNRLFSWDLPD
ncbi:MAG: aspartate ammonia-lyase [Deltaproteobacteria bacterium RBG_13_49_15]|nr:MAG: aspartate ammonia-lyase [Deltaproteobacteria bacterium RBG_13_49_15]